MQKFSLAENEEREFMEPLPNEDESDKKSGVPGIYRGFKLIKLYYSTA